MNVIVTQLKECPYCAEELSEDTVRCDSCGRDLPGQQLSCTLLGMSFSLAHERLERAISTYTAYKYRIVSRTGEAVLMERDGVVDRGLVAGLIFTIWPAAILYAVIASLKRYKVELSVCPNGDLIEMGDAYPVVQHDMEKAGNARNIVWAIFALVMIVACLAGALSGNT
jgi:hypothetical protein